MPRYEPYSFACSVRVQQTSLSHLKQVPMLRQNQSGFAMRAQAHSDHCRLRWLWYSRRSVFRWTRSCRGPALGLHGGSARFTHSRGRMSVWKYHIWKDRLVGTAQLRSQSAKRCSSCWDRFDTKSHTGNCILARLLTWNGISPSKMQE